MENGIRINIKSNYINFNNLFIIVKFSINLFNSDKNKFIGSWKGEESENVVYMVFNRDNSGNIVSNDLTIDFNFDIIDKKLLLTIYDSEITGDVVEVEFGYLFISDNILKLDPIDSDDSVVLDRIE